MEETDEVFLQTLYKGSELIGQGALEEARESLEAAVAMRPDDQKARNLLGLACFKLGDYPGAETLYESLVKENPEDSTLRVNLGLVHLKSGRFEEAIRELEVAVELQPDHRRAQNYLGLAYARVGDYAQAQQCFVAAGSQQMVERMERLMTGEGDEDADVAAAAPDAPPPGADRLDGRASEGVSAARTDVEQSSVRTVPEEAAAYEQQPTGEEQAASEQQPVSEEQVAYEQQAISEQQPVSEEQA
ncbi:MAG: tetratricopeptide repeat protein, partial [Myxococcota bacterium]